MGVEIPEESTTNNLQPTTMKKLIVFNWKSNPHNAASAIKLAQLVEKSIPKKNAPEVVIAPPFIFLEDVGKVIKKAALGSQDAFWGDVGSYTGEISWHQEKHLKVKYVIVGHSERRKYLGETDEMINKKVLAALKAGLKVVLCVGEPSRAAARELRIKNAELRKAKNYVRKQLEKDLKNSKFLILNSKLRNHLVIAYEPIWAIGAGHSDTPQDAVEMIKYIKEFSISNFSPYGGSPEGRQFSNIKVIYGGSVDGKNIKNFIQYKEIDGFLVGNASLKQKEFDRIIKA